MLTCVHAIIIIIKVKEAMDLRGSNGEKREGLEGAGHRISWKEEKA